MVVIHGPGRSGTTLVQNILASRGDLAWLSVYNDRFPSLPCLSLLHRLPYIPIKGWPKPTEPYRFWDYFFEGFSGFDRVPRSTPEHCRVVLKKIRRYAGGRRLMIKITGEPRAEQLAMLGMDPQVVYVNRDPKAVVMSYLKQGWGLKTRQVEDDDFKTLVERYTQRYKSSLLGRKKLQRFPFLEVQYEDLLTDRELFFDRILAFLGLAKTDRFSKALRSWEIRTDTNEAWRRDLTKEQIRFVESHVCIERT